MREIKFRAWDNLKKEMIAEGYHVIGEVTVFGLIDQWVQERRGKVPSLEYYGHIIEMQFTGLKDKNGKEIYEGDILAGGMIVCWRDDLASFALRKEGWAYDHYFGEAIDAGNTEIIGNIYENPELLITNQ